MIVRVTMVVVVAVRDCNSGGRPAPQRQSDVSVGSEGSDDMAQQASAIGQCVVVADTLPEDTSTAVRSGVKSYLDFIAVNDLPAMAKRRASLRPVPPGLTEAMRSLLSLMPATPGQRIARERATIAIEQALAARRDLIELGGQAIAPIQWIVIFTLDALILLTLAVVHLDSRSAAVASMLALSTAFAVTLILLIVYDRPLVSCRVTLQPLMHEIRLDGT